MLSVLLLAMATAPDSVITIDRDNVEIAESCAVRLPAEPLPDADGNGVIHVTGDDIIVDFGRGRLRGASSGQSPDTFTGIGVVVTGKGVTIHNLNVSGFKVGLLATGADRLVIEDCTFDDNFRQRLRSTPQAEDSGDWLWPHDNDNHQWRDNYGAAVCVEESRSVVLRRIKVRNGQNGIILDRVVQSLLHDNDCSFLSGWGLAMWRSNGNMISRNAFDFCVRGYSHEVYNRGQDSAGILVFEQCSNNVFAENSATHGGDGFFAFAGKEALGQVNPRDDQAWYTKRGNNDNDLIMNDFSYAAAHGIELTFCFNNRIVDNRLIGNAICGIWGGYSQDTTIVGNEIEGNGEGAYGLERGGINIEHGRNNLIAANALRNNACCVHLWWDEDKDLLESPWGRANNPLSTDNVLAMNVFHGDHLAIHLRQCGATQLIHNQMQNVATEMDADPTSLEAVTRPSEVPRLNLKPVSGIQGSTRPVGARAGLAGRQNIVMTQWGPWDHQSPLLQFVRRFDHADEYQVFGAIGSISADKVRVNGDAFVDVASDRVFVRPKAIDTLSPYELIIEAGGAQPMRARGILTGGSWTVKSFASVVDPREDADRWRREGLANAHELTIDPLDLRFGMGGMTEARGLPIKLPRDHFGTISTRKLTVPPGRWRIRTVSDDGIRVWMNDELVIDDWTWHAPRHHVHEITLDKTTQIDFRVEHFELDGYAVLTVGIERIPP